MLVETLQLDDFAFYPMGIFYTREEMGDNAAVIARDKDLISSMFPLTDWRYPVRAVIAMRDHLYDMKST